MNNKILKALQIKLLGESFAVIGDLNNVRDPNFLTHSADRTKRRPV